MEKKWGGIILRDCKCFGLIVRGLPTGTTTQRWRLSFPWFGRFEAFLGCFDGYAKRQDAIPRSFEREKGTFSLEKVQYNHVCLDVSCKATGEKILNLESLRLITVLLLLLFDRMIEK